MKKPDTDYHRIGQLVDEIGKPLLDQAIADIWAAIHGAIDADKSLVEAKWFAILEKLDETLDPSVLLPLLKVPKKVRPHFEDALKKRLMLCHRPGHGRTTPSYLPMPLPEATARLAVMFVRYLKDRGVPKDKAVELMTLVYDEVPPNKLRDLGSAVRNLKARRARARGAAE